MNLNRKELMDIIQEEIENIAYDRSKNVTGSPIEHDTPAEVEAYEDNWAAGDNIHSNINHLKTGGSKETDVLGVERLVHPTMKESGTMNRSRLREIILEVYKDKKVSELKEFAGSKGGQKFSKAGLKIRQAGTSIRELANEQTGTMKETLNNVSEFVEKLGESIRSVNELEEGSSAANTFPTVSELKQLINAIKKLEK